jgi:hypothetical protein
MAESTSGEGNSVRRPFPAGLLLAVLFVYFAVSWLQVSSRPPATTGVEMRGFWIAFQPVLLYPVTLLAIILIALIVYIRRRYLFPVSILLAVLFVYFAVSWVQVSSRLPGTTGVEMRGFWIAFQPVWLYPGILLAIIFIAETYVLYRISAQLPSRGAWRELVCVQAEFMKHQLKILHAHRKRGKGIVRRRRDREAELDAEAEAACKATIAHLERARQAANPERKPSRMDPLIDVWTGASIEAAFRSLHAAAVAMVPLLSEDEIKARIPEALARLKQCPSTDPRRQEAEKNLRSGISGARHGISGARLRAEYASALEYGYEAKDDEYTRVREFRNILLSATAALTAVVAALCVVGASFPDAVPLCFAPPSTTSPQQETGPVAQPATLPTTDDDPEPDQTTTTTPPTTDDDPEPDQTTTTQGATTTTQEEQRDTVCPSEEQPPGPRGKGRRLPAPGDVTLVALFGLLGGALSGGIAIRKMHGQTTPYGVPVALNLLKLPSGALTAILGILLVRGAFVPGLSQLDSQPQILGYAFFFGIAQQFATRFIDRRAREVLGRVPTKTTPADQDRAKEPASE